MPCYDLTLKGYKAVWDNEDKFRSKELAKADELVRWVRAPNREALDKFIETFKLSPHLDMEPREMVGREHYDFIDGLDLKVNSDGLVDPVLQREDWSIRWKRQWLALEAKVAAIIKLRNPQGA